MQFLVLECKDKTLKIYFTKAGVKRGKFPISGHEYFLLDGTKGEDTSCLTQGFYSWWELCILYKVSFLGMLKEERTTRVVAPSSIDS